MKAFIGKTINGGQIEFNRICELGGGIGGGPARTSGQRLNGLAYPEIAEHLTAYPDANPCHIYFAMGSRRAFPPGCMWTLPARRRRDRTKAFADWNLIDVHSDVYMLATRHFHSGIWV